MLTGILNFLKSIGAEIDAEWHKLIAALEASWPSVKAAILNDLAPLAAQIVGDLVAAEANPSSIDWKAFEASASAQLETAAIKAGIDAGIAEIKYATSTAIAATPQYNGGNGGVLAQGETNAPQS